MVNLNEEINEEDIPKPPSEEVSISPPGHIASSLEMDTEETGDPADERKQIKALHSFEVQVGGKYMLIDAEWFRTWKDWCCYDDTDLDDEEKDEEKKNNENKKIIMSKGPRPGEIDNTPLLVKGSNSRLLSYIREGEHYELLTQTEWSLFQSWYNGGPNILRRGIIESRNSRKAIVELHGVNIKVMLSNAKTDIRDMNVSKAGTVRELKESCMAEFDIKGRDVRLWDYFRSSPFALLDVPSHTLGEANIMDNQEILIELPDDDGKFLIQKQLTGNSNYATERSGAMLENLVVSNDKPIARGVCGLSNLGNTCFMNSTLQCLSNTPPLRHYFESGDFEKDINRGNPLGQEGKLAESFGNLLQLIWPKNNESVSCVSPKGFKYHMGRFRPEFQGYQQHDSSELMNFLLDGLHEDLNRVLEKPYTEAVENDGTKPDNEMALIFLEQHMKRNDSFIHDLFRGQFKSTLVCPCCNNVSVTFDPYTMVSLPLTTLAQERMTSYNLIVWRPNSNGHGRYQNKIKVLVPKGAKANLLMDAVSKETNISLDQLVIGQVTRNFIYKIYDKDASLDYITNHSMLVVYEVKDAKVFNVFERPSYSSYYYSNPSPIKIDSIYSGLTLLFRHTTEEEFTNYYGGSQIRTISTLIGEPFLYCHPKETTPKDLYEGIAKAIGIKMNDNTQLITGKDIKIYVAKDLNAMKVDAQPVDRDDNEPIQSGMHAKLTLVIEFENDFINSLQEEIPGIPIKPKNINNDNVVDGGAAAEDDEDDDEPSNTDMEIDECFDLFETPETLSVEDSWYCGKCKDHVQATKQMELWSTPDVLVLHLKRFSYSRFSRDKLDTAVNFPLDNFDMSRFIKGPTSGDCIYDCVAVSNHMGSLGGGHYTASARGADNKWYKFNDGHASPMSASSVVSSNVYLLFYVKRTKLAECAMANSEIVQEVIENGSGGGENMQNEI